MRTKILTAKGLVVKEILKSPHILAIKSINALSSTLLAPRLNSSCLAQPFFLAVFQSLVLLYLLKALEHQGLCLDISLLNMKY